MRIVFMGTPTFAIESLSMLLQEGYNVVAVVTQPDKPKGRGNKILYSDVKKFAIDNNIEIYQPAKLREKVVVEKLKSYNADLFVTAAYGKILSKEILEIPQLGCINVHASLLPKYRGAAPIQWAIINGEKVTGITTMMTDIGMDTGDILLKKEIKILNDENLCDVHDRLSVLGAEVLKETLICLKKGELKRIPQNNEEATLAPPIKKEMGLINWDNKAINIYNLIRGLNPFPSAYTFYQGNRMRIWKTAIMDLDVGDKKPGEIIKVAKDGIYVASNDKIIRIIEVQFDSCRRMCVDQYICGHEICEGGILGQ